MHKVSYGPLLFPFIHGDNIIHFYGDNIIHFYGDNIIQNLASFLNIPLNKIRVVNVVSASGGAGRRKRSTGIVIL